MKQETIEDIVAQLRVFVPTRLIRLEGFDGDGLVVLDTAKLADRIEAAHRREVVVAKNATTTKENLGVGNAAMREALVMVKRLFDERIMFQPAIREAHKAVNAALAAPPEPTGNNAKMREALEGVRDWLVVHNAYVDTEREIAKLNAALAAELRKVSNPERRNACTSCRGV